MGPDHSRESLWKEGIMKPILKATLHTISLVLGVTALMAVFFFVIALSYYFEFWFLIVLGVGLVVSLWVSMYKAYKKEE